MAAGMRQFMQGRPMPIDGLEIGLRWRHLHIIFCRYIEGAIAANAEVDPGRLDQVFNLWLDQAWWRRRWCRCDLREQVVALIRVENREALEEWNGLGFLTVLARAMLFFEWHKAVGIDDGRAALALADVTAERQRLAEGKPALACESAFDGSPPEN